VDRINLQINENNSTKGKESRGWLKKFRLNALLPHLDSEPKKDASAHELAHLLNKTIEAQIIPRLLIQHSKADQTLIPRSDEPISADEVKYFAELLINSSTDICLGYVKALSLEGRNLNEIYLNLIAPAARRMQCYWELDEHSFTTVTLALGRIQQIMQELSPDFRNKEDQFRQTAGKALLFAMPHSQHTMGVFMLSEFFAQAGWDVCTVSHPSEEEILTLCAKESFDIVGISISYELQWDGMKQLIQKIRELSINSQIGIMAGGALFNAKPELMKQCTADICTLSAADAVIAAETILKSRV
jgi:MerR family transcriptional regulator, light-induced transcriptional regulator